MVFGPRSRFHSEAPSTRPLHVPTSGRYSNGSWRTFSPRCGASASRPLKPWLFGFAFRVASEYRRKRGRAVPLEEPQSVVDDAVRPDAGYESARKKWMVQTVLEEIELDRRAVFVLHDIDGFTGDEIARTLEIPLGTVYSRLRLAREDFAAKIRRLAARGRLE